MNMLHDFVIQYQARIREDINGAGMILCFSLALMIFIFMCNSWLHALRKHMPMSAWTHMPGVPMACALLWLFGAETYRTGAIWNIYRSADHSTLGSFTEASFWSTFGYLAAGGILIGALLRCTFLFAPPFLRRIVWLTALMVTLGFLLMSHLAPHIGI